jgi:LysM repeat protein
MLATMSSSLIRPLPFILCTILILACSGGSDDGEGAQVLSVVLARGRTADSMPIDPTSVFAPNTREIYGIVTLSEVAKSVEVTGVWSYLGPQGTSTPQEMARASVSQPPPTAEGNVRHVALVLRKPTDFDLGIYQLDVQIDDKSRVTLQFSVVRQTAIVQGVSGTPVPPAPIRPASVSSTPAVTPASSTVFPTPGLPPGGVYTIQSGDSLGVLSTAWGVPIDAIVALNNLESASFIVASQVLLVPQPGQVIPAATPSPAPATATATLSPPTAAVVLTPTPTATLSPAGTVSTTPTAAASASTTPTVTATP